MSEHHLRAPGCHCDSSDEQIDSETRSMASAVYATLRFNSPSVDLCDRSMLVALACAGMIIGHNLGMSRDEISERLHHAADVTLAEMDHVTQIQGTTRH